jgi:hypothetical protein
VLYKRYGQVEPGQTISNTERELQTILQRYETHPQIKILAYFRELPPNSDPGEQEAKVQDFRARLAGRGIFFRTYKEPQEFKETLTHDLYNVILRMRLSSFKQTAIRSFWQLGLAGRPTHPRLAILYPPVQREYMGEHGSNVWYRRLAPMIYFEDYKAIQKIQKDLALIGFNDYRVYPNTDPPSDLQFMNRVWVCMPRQRAAIEQLKRYGDAARFRFLPQTRRRFSTIIWRNTGGDEVVVKSPLGRYLKEQRRHFHTDAEWHSPLGDIVAKDYAVLARLSDKSSQDDVADGVLRDFFLAGIRGLGTWGAGWYLDRKYKHLQQHSEDADIQLLLEVTFQKQRIYDVRDVSGEPPSYFQHCYDLNTVKREIRNYR